MRMAQEIGRLIDLLESEPVWQGRAALPTEVQPQMAELEGQLELLRAFTEEAKTTESLFQATKHEYLLRRDQGTLATEDFPGFQQVVDGALMAAVPFNNLQPNLENLVNVFRVIRGAPPLDGAESISN